MTELIGEIVTWLASEAAGGATSVARDVIVAEFADGLIYTEEMVRLAMASIETASRTIAR